jgi:hypothetical protein
MDVVPWILSHGVITQSPGIHFPEREGNDVSHAEGNDEGWMTECLHLVNFEGQPEG